MNLNQTVQARLLDLLRKRNSQIFLPRIGLLLVSVYFFREMILATPWLISNAFLILVTLIVRVYLFKDSSKKMFERCYAFLVFVAGLGWGSFFWFVDNYYGTYSFETLFCGGVILTLLSGGVTAFSSSLKVVQANLISLTLVPAFVLLTDHEENAFILGLLFLSNLGYQLYNSYLAHRDLRKAFKDELIARDRTAFLQEFIDAIPGIVTLVSDEGIHVMVNNHRNGFFKRMLLNRTLGTAFPGSTTSKILRDFLESEKCEDVIELETNELGDDSWFMLHLKRISQPESGIMAVILPITDLVKAKNDLKIHEARAMYAAKLASLGELSAGIAHEVNNPLTIIEGTANLIKLQLQDEPIMVKDVDHSVDKIIHTTHRIAKIIKGLRMLSKEAEEEPFSNVSFQDIIEPSLEISKNKLATYNIELKVNGQNSDVELFGNDIQLGQVVMNLVANAIDAVSAHDGPRWVEVHYRPSFEWIDIDVIDSGPGISEEVSERIMEPFFTTKERQKGTGLGLSISKKIIESHNGTLFQVKDAEHTTFRVRLPRMTLWPQDN